MTKCQGAGVSSLWVDLLEVIETELTVKAGEVVCLEGVNVVRGEGVWRQALHFDKMSITDKPQVSQKMLLLFGLMLRRGSLRGTFF